MRSKFSEWQREEGRKKERKIHYLGVGGRCFTHPQPPQLYTQLYSDTSVRTYARSRTWARAPKTHGTYLSLSHSPSRCLARVCVCVCVFVRARASVINTSPPLVFLAQHPKVGVRKKRTGTRGVGNGRGGARGGSNNRKPHTRTHTHTHIHIHTYSHTPTQADRRGCDEASMYVDG